MNDLLFMNGYGFYVWGAYGAAFIILDILVIKSLLRAGNLKKQRAQLKDTDKDA